MWLWAHINGISGIFLCNSWQHIYPKCQAICVINQRGEYEHWVVLAPNVTFDGLKLLVTCWCINVMLTLFIYFCKYSVATSVSLINICAIYFLGTVAQLIPQTKIHLYKQCVQKCKSFVFCFCSSAILLCICVFADISYLDRTNLAMGEV